MRFADLAMRNIVIWGAGREGSAARAYLQLHLPETKITMIDDDPAAGPDATTAPAAIAEALNAAEVVVKSPGVSLYHPQVQELKARGVPVTSLLNLWLAHPHRATTICITGTKGKSTSSTLLAHVLKKLGKATALAGNIGVPISTIPPDEYDCVVIETSSFQAADLQQRCDIAVLTSLYEDHIDWHGSRDNYHRDKLNLFAHADLKIANRQAQSLMTHFPETIFANARTGFFAQGAAIWNQGCRIGEAPNAYLARPHNLENVCTVLTVIAALQLDPQAALAAMADFSGLPHRQQELGEKNGVLYVNDSISTNVTAALAGLNAYAGRPVILIAGGFDRGVDYAPLADQLKTSSVTAVILLGPAGQRIGDLLRGEGGPVVKAAASMAEAVVLAQSLSRPDSVILLSPGAPSFGLFRDYAERGESFMRLSGFKHGPMIGVTAAVQGS